MFLALFTAVCYDKSIGAVRKTALFSVAIFSRYCILDSLNKKEGIFLWLFLNF